MLQAESDLRCPPQDNEQLFIALRHSGEPWSTSSTRGIAHSRLGRPARSPDRSDDPAARLVRPLPALTAGPRARTFGGAQVAPLRGVMIGGSGAVFPDMPNTSAAPPAAGGGSSRCRPRRPHRPAVVRPRRERIPCRIEGYHTYAEVAAAAKAVATAHPAIASRFTIGKSHQGREIWAMKISDNVGTDENEPEVLYDGGIHAASHGRRWR